MCTDGVPMLCALKLESVRIGGGCCPRACVIGTRGARGYRRGCVKKQSGRTNNHTCSLKDILQLLGIHATPDETDTSFFPLSHTHTHTHTPAGLQSVDACLLLLPLCCCPCPCYLCPHRPRLHFHCGVQVYLVLMYVLECYSQSSV